MLSYADLMNVFSKDYEKSSENKKTELILLDTRQIILYIDDKRIFDERQITMRLSDSVYF